MKIKNIKDDFFGGCFKAISKSSNTSVQVIRNLICYDREALKLSGGGFILKSKRQIIFNMPEIDYSDPKTRPEGYYRIEGASGKKLISYWSGVSWICYGDTNEYAEYVLDIKSIELIELKTL